jgi:hypothetical protein
MSLAGIDLSFLSCCVKSGVGRQASGLRLVAFTALLLALVVPHVHASKSNPAAGQSCSTEARASGSLVLARGRIVFNDSPAKIRAIHCLDVDAFDQAGCVAAYEVEVGKSRGCRLHFQLSRSKAEDVFTLQSFDMSADSLCPGWKDEYEGNYKLVEADLSGGGPLQVGTGQEHRDWACFDGLVRLDGQATLRHGSSFRGKAIEVRVDGLTVRGSIGSAGMVDRPCLTQPKPKPKPKPRPRPKAKPKAPPTPMVPLLPKSHRLDLGFSDASIDVPSFDLQGVAIFEDSESTASGVRVRYSYTPLPPATPISFYGGVEYGTGTIQSVGDATKLTSLSAAFGMGYLISAGNRLEIHPRVGLDLNYRALEIDESPFTLSGAFNSLNMDVSGIGVGAELGVTARMRISNFLAVHGDYAYVIRGSGPSWSAPNDTTLDLLGGSFGRVGAGLTLTF